MQFIGYGRVSRVAGREGDSFISPRVQRETVTHMLAARGHDLIDWLEDLDASGGTTDRPRLQEALRRVEAGEANGIAVAKLDRFARTLAGALNAIERIDQAGGHLLSAAENFDTTTPMGRAMLQITLVFAELERARITEAAAVAREEAVRRGVHIANRIVLGYRRRPDRGLEPDPATASLIPEIFRRRAAGESWAQLAAWLDGAAPQDGKWLGTTVARLISNRVYLGESRHGDFVNAVAHEPLVTRAEWEAAQSREKRVATRGGSLLAGILVCGSCGRPMTHGRARRDQDAYRCQRRSSAGVCPRPTLISARAADDAVEGELLRLLADHPIRFGARARGKTIDQAVERLEAAEEELAAYRDTSLVSVLGVEAFSAGVQERARRVDDARQALAAEQDAVPFPVRGFDLAQDWPTLDLAVRRQLVAAAYERIVCIPTSRGSRAAALERLRFVPLGNDDEVRVLGSEGG